MNKLVTYDPFAELSALQRQFFGDDALSALKGVNIPTTDVYTKDNELIVEAHLPNFNQEDVDIQVHEGSLVVQAERHEKEEDKNKKYGIGLAAPQVGHSLAISVLNVHATPNHPDVHEDLKMVIINPRIVETFGRRTPKWEGCISGGAGNNILYGQTMRYKKLRLAWDDEKAIHHEQEFDGLAAHVMQHEIDHLMGILFVDRVHDSKTFMMADEYRKMMRTKNASKEARS